MCSPNVHYEQRPLPFDNNPFSPGASSARDQSLSPSEASTSAYPLRPLSPKTATLHHTITHCSSVLSLAVDESKSLVFSGSQSECIYVWDLKTYQQRTTLQGHTCSVLALELAPEKNWLFSSSGDNTVRIWDTKTLKPLYVVYPSEDNVGDIFALKWSKELETLYLGCQNTSVQWICLTGVATSAFKVALGGGLGTESPSIATPSTLPISRPHKFFDSIPVALSRSNGGVASNSGFSTPQLPTAPGKRRGRVASASWTTPRSSLTDRTLEAAAERLDIQAEQEDTESQVGVLVVPPTCSVLSAHYGYIYCFTLLSLEGDEAYRTVLASGSGDETAKLWHATPRGLEHLATLESPNAEGNAVMALATWKSTLFTGLQGGDVEVWDLETCTLVRTIRAHTDDVLGLETCSMDGCLFTASADGRMRRWDRSFKCTDEWVAHDGIILSLSIRANGPKIHQLITGSSDDRIKIWNLPGRSSPAPVPYHLRPEDHHGSDHPSIPECSTLLSNLSQFITYKSVSSKEENREDCRQAAHYLKACLIGLGAEAKILANVPGRNPLVLATFYGNGRSSCRRENSLSTNGRSSRSRSTGAGIDEDSLSGSFADLSASITTDSDPPKRKRCLFYGHYDVIAAEGSWSSDPFQMDGRDGYLYGRGVSDNKGPILAAACAASQLLTMRKLDVDVVFLIEGEEETGSIGFTEAVRRHKDEIGPIDVILLSNSYWLDEDTPCLTIGLRGVVRATIEVSGDEPDVHSGVEGGAVREPMIDMIKVLSSLSDGDRVTIPGFYDSVRPVTTSEELEYSSIAKLKESTSAESLMSKWRHPSLSVHRIRVSGPGNSTVIPSQVSATVSLRLVPDQSLDEIERSLRQHIQTVFSRIQGGNRVNISIEHRANWWLGSSESPFFRSLQSAVSSEWNLSTSPISIREGGSIPAVAILETELGAQAVHLPMGQSSDRAHLPNERIRLTNLHKGKSVVSRFLESIAGLQS